METLHEIIQKLKKKAKAKNPYFFASLRNWHTQKTHNVTLEHCLKTLENFVDTCRIKVPKIIADFSTENEDKKINHTLMINLSRKIQRIILGR